ncbi:MAG: TetR family transcriptional regulator [Clostridia bacterium]|nr:TetR family transcriptional regulator [Deltaproteobacteria bacterium]
MGLRDDKKQNLKAKFRDAALALIAAQGYEATTIEQIASAVNTSPRTFIRYFPTKEDVIVSWVEDAFRAMVDDFQCSDSGLSAACDLKITIRKALARYEQDRSFFISLERIILASPTLLARKLARIEEIIGDLTRLLAKRDGKNPNGTSPDVVTRVLLGVMGSTIMTSCLVKKSTSLTELFDHNLQHLEKELWQS